MTITMRFNSQRDGILPKPGVRIGSENGCFNSQRDGILPSFSKLICSFGVFQFPTGWNSTSSATSTRTQKIVSIPNGMEFYAYGFINDYFKQKFQFPTGWNSTKMVWDWMSILGSFNSQRDGILLCAIRNEYKLYFEFQFPTGWNSTLSIRKYLLSTLWVSIPNGMEFYSTNFAIFLGRKC